jgi:hypothetical protein
MRIGVRTPFERSNHVTAEDDWIRTLRTATQTTLDADGPSMPRQAAAGLRLAWITTEAVQVTDTHRGGRWTRLRDHIENIRNEIAPMVTRGLALDQPGPAEMLVDSDQLFLTTTALAGVSQAVLGDYWQGEISGERHGAMARMDARMRANVELVLRDQPNPAAGTNDRLLSRAEVHGDLPTPAHPGPSGQAMPTGLARG